MPDVYGQNVCCQDNGIPFSVGHLCHTVRLGAITTLCEYLLTL